jgi:hypothetical protein
MLTGVRWPIHSLRSENFSKHSRPTANEPALSSPEREGFRLDMVRARPDRRLPQQPDRDCADHRPGRIKPASFHAVIEALLRAGVLVNFRDANEMAGNAASPEHRADENHPACAVSTVGLSAEDRHLGSARANGRTLHPFDTTAMPVGLLLQIAFTKPMARLPWRSCRRAHGRTVN